MNTIAPPVLILASRGSQGSFLAALLGAHPELQGAPHLNLLPFEYTWQYLTYCVVPRDTNIHGLLRFLGQTLLGEQTMQSVQAARRWANIRRERTTDDLYTELSSLVAPLRLVDYSPLHAQNLEVMRRVAAKRPEAPIIHLVSNPVTQGQRLAPAVWQTINTSLGHWSDRGENHPCMDPYEIGEQFIDWSSTPPVFDPQFAWYRTQTAARQLFDELPGDRCIRLTTETLMADPAGALAEILPKIGVASDATVIAEMLKDRDRTYSLPGPFGNTVGVDYEMLGKSVSEVAQLGAANPVVTADAPLEWRGDDDVFQRQVIDLAAELGYSVS